MKKIFLLILLFVSGLILLIFLFISPLVKYEIEKNSVKWTGRKIKIESMWINIFTGSIHVENFKMIESNSEKTFISFKDFFCDIEVLKLFSKKYEVSPITLDAPEINIIETGSKFNFDDLIKRFADTTEVKTRKPQDPIKYFIKNFSITNGVVNYSTTQPPTDLSILNLNITSPPISYSDSVYNISSDFSFNTGGKISTQFMINAKSMDYALHLVAENHKLNFLAAYMKDFMKVKSFDAELNTDLKISGNINHPQEVAVKGTIDAKNFSIIDTTGGKLTSFSDFKVGIDSLNTKAGIYNFNYLSVQDPFLKFALFDKGTNFDRVLVQSTADSNAAAPVENYSNIFQMMAGYISSLSTEYLLKQYRVDKLDIKNGDIVFTDYTLEDKFQYVLDSMNLHSDNFNSANERINITASSRLNTSGILNGTLSVNPHGYKDMDIHYKISDLLISDINPYSKYYVATPFADGKVLFESNSIIVDNQLKSTNRLFIEKIKVGSKTSVKGLYDLPVKLAVAILRDPKGNIDFEIPVEGNLNDPSFKLGKIIWQIFKNLIIKAVKAPFNLIAKAFGGKEDDYKEIRFEYLQKGVTADQEKTLNNLAKLLTDKPDLGIEFVQLNNKEDEEEQLALFISKKQFLGLNAIDSLSAEQHKQVVELSNKDSVFVNWIDSVSNTHSALTSIQETCVKYIGKEKLQPEVDAIMEKRNSFLMNFFTLKNISNDRIKISSVKKEVQAAKESQPRFLINLISNENTNLADSSSASNPPAVKK